MAHSDDIFSILTAQSEALNAYVTAQIKAGTDPLNAQLVTARARIAELEAALAAATPTPPASTSTVTVTGFVAPGDTGWGKAGRTTTLNVHRGDLFLNSAQATVKDLDVYGRIICGDNVEDLLLDNVKVRGTTSTPYTSEVLMVDTRKANRVKVRYSEIYCESGWGGANGLGTKNFDVQYSNIHHCVDPIRVNRSGAAPDDPTLAIIRYNWLHDAILDGPDPLYSRTDKKTHSDLIQIEGGDRIYIENNYLDAMHSPYPSSSVVNTTSTSPFIPVASGGIPHPQALSAIMITPAGTWKITNLFIRNNFLDGGEVTINGPTKATGEIVNNKFGRNSLQKVPMYPKTSSTMRISGNVYADNGQAI